MSCFNTTASLASADKRSRHVPDVSLCDRRYGDSASEHSSPYAVVFGLELPLSSSSLAHLSRIVDTNSMTETRLTDYAKQSHATEPGTRYLSEVVLRDPRGDPVYNHRTENAMARWESAYPDEDEMEAAILEAEDDDEEAAKASFEAWKAQDQRFVALETEAAEQRQKDDDDKLAAWGGRKRAGAVPKMRDDPVESHTYVQVPPNIMKAVEECKYFNLSELHPEFQTKFVDDTLNNLATHQTGFDFEQDAEGKIGIKPQGPTRRTPGDTECTLDYLLLAFREYIRLLRQVGQVELADKWEEFVRLIANNPRRNDPLGDEFLVQMIAIHRRNWHLDAVVNGPNNPTRIPKGLADRAQTACNDARELRRRKADEERTRAFHDVSAYLSFYQ
jgi:hypothetical protein